MKYPLSRTTDALDRFYDIKNLCVHTHTFFGLWDLNELLPAENTVGIIVLAAVDHPTFR